MSEERFFFYILGTIACLVAFTAYTCAWKADRETQAISRMVQAGADPIAAKCSLQGSDSRDPACLYYVMKKGAPE